MKERMRANIPLIYKPIFADTYKFLVYYGGRGGGKSENIAQALIIRSTIRKEKILCAREIQASIKDSVKALLEKWINELGLDSFFRIKHNEIVAKNGSRFVFKGFSNLSIMQLKSMADISITWFEEADVMSERSWEIGLPSVMRKQTSKIVISFNPRFESDIVYKTFITNKPPQDSYVCKVNFDNNPFFKNSSLDMLRIYDLEFLSKDEYEHKWLGNLQRQTKGALFNDSVLSKMSLNDSFRRDDYVRLVISCDPATTSKQHSNKYGVIVCGLNNEGLGIILEDASNIFSPLEFSVKVNELYNFYNADCVIVEVNQGGDFIKHTLLSYNPRLIIGEVRAIKDKINRAMPIANLCAIGKVKFLGDLKQYSDLVRQMRLMNAKGFMGASGESPDSVDALVWGLNDLFNLGDTQEALLRLEWFKQDSSFVSKRQTKAFLATNNNETCVLVFNIVSNAEAKCKILISDYLVCNNADLEMIVEYCKELPIICPDLPLFDNIESDVYTQSKENLNDLTMQNMAYFKQNMLMLSDDLPFKKHVNMSGNLLKIAISRYNSDDSDDVFVKALNELVLYFM